MHLNDAKALISIRGLLVGVGLSRRAETSCQDLNLKSFIHPFRCRAARRNRVPVCDADRLANYFAITTDLTMKRKLDDNNVPAATEADDSTNPSRSFEDLKLDPRLLQALTQQKFTKPTLVQAEAIPLALSGKDILARAKTGSGKTAAYLLPALQSILQKKAVRYLKSPCDTKSRF